MLIPSTYALPLITRLYPCFNNPYLELVHQVHLLKSGPLNIIDIGASVGDTFHFINQNIPSAVNKIFCIEGHPVYQQYLTVNTSASQAASILPVVLSDRETDIKSLENHHNSSALSNGSKYVKAVPLDQVIAERIHEPIHVIKIDTDGFDGLVLKGSSHLLQEQKPLIIFEYHPVLIRQTGNDLTLHFTVLCDAGYDRLVWFDKYGVFSFFSDTNDHEFIATQARACIEAQEEDLHYDVIAIPKNSMINTDELAAGRFSRNKLHRH